MLSSIDEGIRIHRLWWEILRSIGLKGDWAQWISNISLVLILVIITYSIYRILHGILQGEYVKQILNIYIKESKVYLIQEEILLYVLRIFICLFFIGLSHAVLDSTTARLHALPMMDFLATLYVIFSFWYIIHHSLYIADDIYRSYRLARRLPITSYIQTLQIIIFIAFLMVISSLSFSIEIGSVFAGLGAMTAAIILIFKDSIVGFASSLQVALVDIARVGDWITIPHLNVDGDIIELSVWNTKIRNFDRTIVSIPSSALVNHTVINWRAMQVGGGRRIKRSILIDAVSIKLMDDELMEKLKQNVVLKEYLNKLLIGNDSRVVNLNMFRKYLELYFDKHDSIHHEGFTCLVRLLQPTEFGVPLEVYVFTKTVIWKEYEAIQSKIIEDIICGAQHFGLKIYQRP